MEENKTIAPDETETPAPASERKPATPAQTAAMRKEHVAEGLARCKRNGWVDRTLLTLEFDGLDSVDNEDARSLIESLGNKRFNKSPPNLDLSPAELNALHFEAVRLKIVKAK